MDAVGHGERGVVQCLNGVWIALLLFAVSGALTGPVHAQQRVYVQAFDERTGAIVTDLQIAEVIVRADGVTRAVSDVRLANLPLRLVVVVDNGPAGARAFGRVQDGLRAFMDRVALNQNVSILTVAPTPRWVARDALGQEEAHAAVDRLSVEREASTMLLDGLVAATESVDADDRFHRAVVVIVTTDGVDASAEPVTQFEAVTEWVRRTGITVHTLLLSTPAPGSILRRMSVPEAIGRDLAGLSGGMYTSIILGSSLTQQLGEIADQIGARTQELARQYVIRYDGPSGSGPEEVQVSISRFGTRYTVTSDGKLPSDANERDARQ
jgi:hypothetical protein